MEVASWKELSSLPLGLLLPLIRARQSVRVQLRLHVAQVLDAVGRVFGLELELYVEYTALMCWQKVRDEWSPGLFAKGAYIQPHYDANRPYLIQRHISAVRLSARTRVREREGGT